MILERLEDRTFEIAVFGRVSSGKSSLLNAVLGTDVLPVGVTPITAVPTRTAYGEKPTVTVWFADRPAKQLPLSSLSEFVTEQQNPGNGRHVSRVLVHLPSAHLSQGIVLVDTPGLGSLATTGAAETMAYMPRCDLCVVLIDAASSITPDDLETIRALYRAGTPANVLLSKSDLLSPTDTQRLGEYTRKQILSELGLEVAVRGVSTLPAHHELLQEWFDTEIRPLYERSQELKTASLRRKVGSLRNSIAATLSMQLRRAGATSQHRERLEQAETRLRHATARLEEARTVLRRVRGDIESNSPKSLELLGRSIAEQWKKAEYRDPIPDVLSVARSLTQERAMVLEQYLRSLVSESLEALFHIAEALESADRPSQEDFSSLIREMPVFEFPAGELRLVRPKLAILGKGHFERTIASQIEKQIGTSYIQGVITYAALLQAWAERVLQHIRQQFELYAEGYRAQLERSLSGQHIASEATSELRRDLSSLGVNENEPATVGSR
jgi:GTP-binding protein EngB required for normal cell division